MVSQWLAFIVNMAAPGRGFSSSEWASALCWSQWGGAVIPASPLPWWLDIAATLPLRLVLLGLVSCGTLLSLVTWLLLSQPVWEHVHTSAVTLS